MTGEILLEALLREMNPVEAHDGIEPICRGRHERFIIYADKFNRKVAAKASTGQ